MKTKSNLFCPINLVAVFSVQTKKGNFPDRAQVLAERFGSESINRVCPCWENNDARQIELVVFPTPPL